MSDKVVSLSGQKIPDGSPNQCAIEALEEVLEKARAGEICGVVLCALYADRSASYQINGMVGGYSLLGAVDIAKAELSDEIRGIF